MKTMPCGFERRAEGRALGQEAVAGMHGFGPGRLAGLDDLLGDEIALRRRRRADMHRLVGHLDMHRVAVGVGIDRDRRDPHPPRRLDDAAGDLAAIGDQDFLEHRDVPLPRPASRQYRPRPLKPDDRERAQKCTPRAERPDPDAGGDQIGASTSR